MQPNIQRLKLRAVNDQIEVLEAQLNSQIKNNEQLIKIIRNINNADYFKSLGDSFYGEYQVKIKFIVFFSSQIF